MFWAVIFGFGAWAVIGYLIPSASDHLTAARKTDEKLRQTLDALAMATAADRPNLLRIAERHRQTRNDHYWRAAPWLVGSLGLYVWGIWALSLGFSGSQTAVLVFGTMFLGAAFALIRQRRRNWRRFAGWRTIPDPLVRRRTFVASRLNAVGLVICLLAGSLILGFGL